MKRINNMIVISILVAVSLLAPVEAYARSRPNIIAHDIDVIIIQKDSLLLATDSVTLDSGSNGKFSFTLNKNLKIDRVNSSKGSVDYIVSPYEGPMIDEEGFADTFQQVTIMLPKGETDFSIRYSGVINDPIEASKALGRVRGDMTSGIINDEGVYLSSGTGWYPKVDDSMATFRVKASVPDHWFVVTQGDLLSREVKRGRRISIWDSEHRYDGLALVASNFVVRTRTIDGVDCSTYILDDDDALSDSFLDALEEYLPAYTELFGEFPYSRFDVVENFFSTGYGMPGFTLLGPRVLRMPYATLEGSLAHELVHCWWGNYVFPDWDNGNWCEGLTYFSTNYYWNVLAGTEDDAREFRYNDMQKYTLQVSPEEEYPVRNFRMKFTEEDGNVGYGKASGIFSMVHQVMGKDDFFRALRLVIERHGGKVTDWDDFQAVFEEVSGMDFERFFESWLENAGTPAPTFDRTRISEVDGHCKIEIAIFPGNEKFEFPLKVKVDQEDGGVAMIEFWQSEDVSNVSLILPSKPVSLTIDPDYDVFRRLDRDEISPCINGTRAADSLIVVLPDGGDDQELMVRGYGPPREETLKGLYEGLGQQMVDSGADVTIKYASEVTSDDLSSSSIICFGNADINSITGDLISEADQDQVSLDSSGFTVAGEEYSADSNAALLSIRNPYNDDYDVTFYFANSAPAASRVELIFHYGNWSYVIFEDGHAVKREKWAVGGGPLSLTL